MNQPVLFFSDLCPDTPPFVAALAARNMDYEAVNITASMKNLKRFLALRDSHAAFDARKAQGAIGIPVLQLADDSLVFHIEDLPPTV
jgi:glutaredoxin-related protein